MSARLISLVIFAGIAFGQEPTPTPTFDVWFLQGRDPKSDLMRSIALGEMRFLCLNISLAGVTCPGTAAEWRMAKQGTRLIGDGAGCVPRSEQHLRATLNARDYASSYNELLFEYLRSHE